MSSDLPKHLSDEQFSDLLAGELPDEAVRGHLKHCDYCRGELAAVQAELSDFNISSLTWAQRTAARKIQRPSLLRLRVSNLPSWGVGLAGTVAAVIVMLGIGQPFDHAPDPVTAKIVIPAPSDAQIARDNQMLESIDQQLSVEAEATVPAAELMVAAHRSAHRMEAVFAY